MQRQFCTPGRTHGVRTRGKPSPANVFWLAGMTVPLFGRLGSLRKCFAFRAAEDPFRRYARPQIFGLVSTFVRCAHTFEFVDMAVRTNTATSTRSKCVQVFRAVRSRLSVCWRCGFSVSQVLRAAVRFRNCFVVDTLGTQKNT